MGGRISEVRHVLAVSGDSRGILMRGRMDLGPTLGGYGRDGVPEADNGHGMLSGVEPGRKAVRFG
jgi:hypothetical protein